MALIYLDNAATSWPKPPEVMKAMANAIECAGGNPGRSGHRLSIAAGRIVLDVREKAAAFFGVDDPLRVIFTVNATAALNLAIQGILRSGDRALTSSMEHNSVMRPLRHLSEAGVKLEVIPSRADGTYDLDLWSRALEKPARLVVVNHASNVVGTLAPLAELAQLAHSAGALFLVDAAQTAGVVPIDMKEAGIDLLAFAGHKGTLGPGGTGGLVINDDTDHHLIKPLLFGGTGSLSDKEVQPDFLPDKLESGTLNVPGLAGLGAGIDWINERGVDAIREHEKRLTTALFEGLSLIPGVKVFGCLDPEKCIATVSFDASSKNVSELGYRLDEEYRVLCRVGLHCAPAAHRTIGSFPQGTVRLAPGNFTTMAEIKSALKAIETVLKP
jgi:cysteine desulfurase / selenocysteine lyase